MDEHKKQETESQLDIWGVEIDRRAAVLAPVDRIVRFAVLQHIDELKILHATARARFAPLTAIAAGERADLEKDFADAWNELAIAVGKPLPR
jgi:hypothetical protein